MTHYNRNLGALIFKTMANIMVILALAFLLMPVSPVLANQANPDSTPTVEQFNFYRNLLETDDMLLVIYYNIPYAALPDEDVTQAFIWRLFDTDNVTELGATVGYANNGGGGYNYGGMGYGYSVASMYWSAADNLTWEQDYIVTLSGNPAIFDTPPEYSYPVDSSDYSSLVSQADEQAELASRILNIATDLDVKWALPSTQSLLSEGEGGTYLSTYGESFFRGAIYGLQGLAPGVIYFSVGNIAATDRTWNTDYSTNLTTQYTGTWVGTSQTAGAAMFSTSYDLMTLTFWVVLAIVAFFATLWLSRGETWAGFIDAFVILLAGARLGFFDPNFLGFITALCWEYTAAKTWGFLR